MDENESPKLFHEIQDNNAEREAENVGLKRRITDRIYLTEQEDGDQRT